MCTQWLALGLQPSALTPLVHTNGAYSGHLGPGLQSGPVGSHGAPQLAVSHDDASQHVAAQSVCVHDDVPHLGIGVEKHVYGASLLHGIGPWHCCAVHGGQ